MPAVVTRAANGAFNFDPTGYLTSTATAGSRQTAQPGNGVSYGSYSPYSTGSVGSIYAGIDGLRSRLIEPPGNYTRIDPGTFRESQYEGRADEIAAARLEGLNDLPNRTQLALEAFDIYQRQSDPAYQQRLRGVTDLAAATGRIGSGVTTSNLGDVASERNRELGLLKENLANETAGLRLQDEMDILNAALGSASEFQRRNISNQGFELTLRDEARGEENRLADLNYRDRNEYRDERGRLDSLSQLDIENRLRQRQQEQDEQYQRYLLELQRLGYLQGVPGSGNNAVSTGTSGSTQTPTGGTRTATRRPTSTGGYGGGSGITSRGGRPVYTAGSLF